jgi:hypothetical protein
VLDVPDYKHCEAPTSFVFYPGDGSEMTTPIQRWVFPTQEAANEFYVAVCGLLGRDITAGPIVMNPRADGKVTVSIIWRSKRAALSHAISASKPEVIAHEQHVNAMIKRGVKVAGFAGDMATPVDEAMRSRGLDASGAPLVRPRENDDGPAQVTLPKRVVDKARRFMGDAFYRRRRKVLR